MKAAQITKYGGADVLRINRNASMPSLSSGQVLVKMKAAGVNPADWKIREGYMQQMAPLRFPATLGGDFSGIIVEVGEGVSGFKKGDEVYGTASPLAGSSGSFAEFISVNAKSIAKKPKNANFTEAAALPLAGISALDVLYNKMMQLRGKKILIHGGTGGIGSIAIQIAKHLGAFVATTVSFKHREFAKELGADEVIDYESQAFENFIKGYDAVFDTVGGDTYKKSFGVLKKGGVIISMVGGREPELEKKYGVMAVPEYTAPAITTENLTKLAQLVDKGVIKIRVDRTFPLDKTADALSYQQTGHPSGKVAIEI